MNILFIYSDLLEYSHKTRNPKKPLYYQNEIQLGISYISSVLKQHHHRTDLLVVTRYTGKKDLDRAINTFKPELICFSAVFREFETITRIAAYIKTTYPAIFLLAGGPHVSLNPEAAIKENFDAICIGEGEYPVLELVTKLEKGLTLEKIDNLWIKTADGVARNPTRAYIQELDDLPFPDRDIWQKWIADQNAYHVILLGRGCPFNCPYCCNHALRQLSGGKYVRFRSPDNIIREVSQIIKQFPDIDYIYFEAEAINLYLDFLIDFCNKLAAYNKTLVKKISYGVNLRIIPAQDIRNLFYWLQTANIKVANIGLESGNERIRKEILKRDYSNDEVVRVVKTAQEFGIWASLYIMIGIPTETTADFKDTINIAKASKPDQIQLSIFCPYPGTDLYQYCLENKIITGEVKDRGRDIVCMDLPGFSKKQIQKQYDYFMANVYANNVIQYLVLIIKLFIFYNWKRMIPSRSILTTLDFFQQR